MYLPDGSGGYYRQDGTYIYSNQHGQHVHPATAPSLPADKQHQQHQQQQSSASYTTAPSIYSSWSAVHESSVRSSNLTPETITAGTVSSAAASDAHRTSGSSWPDTSSYGYYARQSAHTQPTQPSASSSVHRLTDSHQSRPAPAAFHSTFANRPIIDEVMRGRLRQAYDHRGTTGFSTSHHQSFQQPAEQQRSDSSYSNGSADRAEASSVVAQQRAPTSSAYLGVTSQQQQQQHYTSQSHATTQAQPTYSQPIQHMSSSYNDDITPYPNSAYHSSSNASLQQPDNSISHLSPAARLAEEIRRESAARAAASEPPRPIAKPLRKKAAPRPKANSGETSRAAGAERRTLQQAAAPPASSSADLTPPASRAQVNRQPAQSQRGHAGETSTSGYNAMSAPSASEQAHNQGREEAAQSWQQYEIVEQPEDRGVSP